MICALCKTNPTKEDSHIIPRLVYKWLKSVSLSGHLRSTGNPNQRTQDGPKIKLLCPDCEDTFSKLETKFSNDVFRPLHIEEKNNHSFEYDNWFLKFAVSISWRSLIYLHLQEDLESLPNGHGPHAKQALKQWEAFLNQEQSDIGVFNQHLILMDTVVSATGIENNFDLNLYIQRGIEFNTVHSSKECYIFTKLGRVVIAGTILNVNPKTRWEGTEIHSTKGRYAPGEFWVSDCFNTFLSRAIDSMRESRAKISPKQRGKMDDAFYRKFGFYPPK